MTSLRKALDSNRNNPGHENGATACYEENEQALALQVQDSLGDRWIFPWTHFLHAKFSTKEGDDQLLLTFVTHEVHLIGHNLDLLVPAVSTLALGQASLLPSVYRHVINTDPFISKIAIIRAGSGGG